MIFSYLRNMVVEQLVTVDIGIRIIDRIFIVLSAINDNDVFAKEDLEDIKRYHTLVLGLKLHHLNNIEFKNYVNLLKEL